MSKKKSKVEEPKRQKPMSIEEFNKKFGTKKKEK